MKVLKVFMKMLVAISLFSSCEKDNFEAPKSKLTGKVVYQGEALGLRSDGVQLELWQHGYDLFNKIPVYVAQDGSFSAEIFDGNYKLTLVRGNGPWAESLDSLDLKVSGNTTIDFPVDPYFIIQNESFQQDGDAVHADLHISHINTGRDLDRVKLYIGETVFVDGIINVTSAEKLAADIDTDQSISLAADIPETLRDKGYAFVRIGVKTIGVAEFIYSQPVRIELN